MTDNSSIDLLQIKYKIILSAIKKNSLSEIKKQLECLSAAETDFLKSKLNVLIKFAGDNGNIEIIKYLLDLSWGSIKEEYLHESMVSAGINGNLDAVNFFLELEDPRYKKINVNAYDFLALKRSLEFGSLNVAKYLLERIENIGNLKRLSLKQRGALKNALIFGFKKSVLNNNIDVVNYLIDSNRVKEEDVIDFTNEYILNDYLLTKIRKRFADYNANVLNAVIVKSNIIKDKKPIL